MWQGGEQPLPKHGACNLCSINVSEYVLNPYTGKAKLDWDSLQKDIYTIVREMDRVLEENLNRHALPEQREMAEKYRNIGIGIMGLADYFVKFGIRYGSPESIKEANTLMSLIFRSAIITSVKNGEDLGNFPGYSDRIWDASILKKVFNEEELSELKKNGHLRNCSLLSIAPTGSIGTMFNISTGVEPFFALSFNRKTVSMSGDTYKVEIKAVEEYRKITGDTNNVLPEYFVTAQDIPWNERIDMQAALQEFCDTAISSTVNLPKETTIDDVKKLYKYAWKNKLKGVTIYREGSRDPILFTDKKEEVQLPNSHESPCEPCLDSINTISRDDLGQVLSGNTYKYHTACGTLYITVNKDEEGNIVEVFTNSSKNGTCKANLNGETRLVSLALRAGVKTEEVIDTLKSIQCQSCAFSKARGNKIDGTSCPDIIAKCLKQSYNKISKSTLNEKEELDPPTQEFVNKLVELAKEVGNSNKCPECGQELIHSGGCVQCSCGFSKCN